MKPFVRFASLEGKPVFCSNRYWDFDDLLQKKLLYLLRQIADPETISKACIEQWKRNMDGLRRDSLGRLDEGRLDVTEPERFARRGRILLESAGRGGLVLYVGCGTGQNSIAWAGEGLRVVGIDTDMALLAVANRWGRRFPYPAVFAGMDMVRMGFRSETFDGFLLELYGSLPDAGQTISFQRELARIMKKDGIGLVVAFRKRYPSYWFLMDASWPVPMVKWLAEQVRLDFFFGEKDACEEALQYGLFVQYHTEESLAAELSRTFEVVSCRYEADPRYLLAVVRKGKRTSGKLAEPCIPARNPHLDLDRIGAFVGEAETLCGDLLRHAAQVAAFFSEGGKGSECLARFSPPTQTFQAHLESVCAIAGKDTMQTLGKNEMRRHVLPRTRFR
jgi:SAM-dependent methyltransferase